MSRNGRDAGRVLLVEDLDAVGADVEDARRRAARIQEAGRSVTWVAVAPPGGIALEDAEGVGEVLLPRDDAGEALAAMTAGGVPVVLASAWEGGGPLTRWLPRDARWWPTGWSATPARMGGWMRGEHRLEPLDGAAGGGAEWLVGWSEIDPPASRRPRLPLWDGDIVLALSGLEGAGGNETIAAFAQVAEEWSGVDLVAWSHPSPELERHARSWAIDLRVHGVGPAPRRAESSWLLQAAVALIDGRSRVSAGLVLRVLAAGCPLLWVGREGRGASIARWLEQHGCARVVEPHADAIAGAIHLLLERDDEVEAGVERGRSLAARHEPRAIVERLAAIGRVTNGQRAA